MDKLSSQIFSILESHFLFPKSPANSPAIPSSRPKIRILSIDSSADGLLAALALSRLQSSLRRLSGDPTASIADFFDIAAGSGLGSVLVSVLFSRDPISADSSLRLLSDLRRRRRRHIWYRGSEKSAFRSIFPKSATIRDTLKPVLVPCYDTDTRSPLLFSTADAMEMEGCDFGIADVCAATCAERAVRITSVDGAKRVVAVGGGAAVSNPTAAAITHVLNNKREFPSVTGVEDLMVVSIGGSDIGGAKEMAKIAAEGAADMVDMAVAMAFEQSGTCNYVRIQGNAIKEDNKKPVKDMLAQRNIKSLLFRGKKVLEETNGERLEWSAGELVKEHERRSLSKISHVVTKDQLSTPRTSSVMTTTTLTSSGTMLTSP